ncbi:MAG: helix-turn-helix domain-containing protein [Rhodococcus sp. (in: high G+C Gram-positive bacteria)]|uniref:PucR family transcriptional regulator n=1 Tax=Rhodococcus sp. TaxID=1831 RepID=UPI003BB1ADB9
MNLDAFPNRVMNGIPEEAELRSVVELTARMYECRGRDDILGLMAEAVGELGQLTIERSDEPPRSGTDEGWRRRVEIDDSTSPATTVTLCAVRPPSPVQRTLLDLVLQHASAAMRTQTLRARSVRREEENAALTADVARLQREVDVYGTFGRLSVAEVDERAVATALHELTGLSVGFEDAFGHLRVWTGPGKTSRYRRIGGRNRIEVLRRASMDGHPVRDDNRIVHVIRPGQTLLGLLYVWDPEHLATDSDLLALERAAAVLAVELSHRRSLAETEARLSRDLGADLLAGTGEETACARADALGYDLRTAQRVVVVQCTTNTPDTIVTDVMRRHFRSTETPALLVPAVDERPDIVAAIAEATVDPNALWAALEKMSGRAAGIIAVGSECGSPGDVPTSYAHALRTLEIRRQSLSPSGVARFEELGVYRILDSHSTTDDVESFVREWLGPLLEYDREHRSTMTATLAQYLDCGGKYDETAQALRIHRSTLRYRMSRIHDLTGRDLRSVDTRLNLHLATRALQVLAGGTQP